METPPLILFRDPAPIKVEQICLLGPFSLVFLAQNSHRYLR